jgi:hypothetical protein
MASIRILGKNLEAGKFIQILDGEIDIMDENLAIEKVVMVDDEGDDE